ncbi:MAG: hypothetical protein GX921_02330, partial [Bacteroidales bacterium]|nr:hypothetical protein [Bacteroidales bacterium]
KLVFTSYNEYTQLLQVPIYLLQRTYPTIANFHLLPTMSARVINEGFPGRYGAPAPCKMIKCETV